MNPNCNVTRFFETRPFFMKEKLFTIGGVLTSLLASACCLAPAVLLMLGITGLGFLSGLEWSRPYLLAVTFAFLGLAYRSAYGKGRGCGKDGVCWLGASRLNKILFWVLAAFAVFGVVSPYLAPPFTFMKGKEVIRDVR